MKPEKDVDLKGINSISGWLIAVQVFIILNAFGWIRNMDLFFGLLGEKDKLIESQKIANPFLYNAFIYYEITASIIFTVFSVAVVYYMIKRAKFFPSMFIIYIVLNLVVEAFVLVIFSEVSETPLITKEKLIFSVVIGVLLIIYIKVSKRVKQTFTI